MNRNVYDCDSLGELDRRIWANETNGQVDLQGRRELARLFNASDDCLRCKGDESKGCLFVAGVTIETQPE